MRKIDEYDVSYLLSFSIEKVLTISGKKFDVILIIRETDSVCCILNENVTCYIDFSDNSRLKNYKSLKDSGLSMDEARILADRISEWVNEEPFSLEELF